MRRLLRPWPLLLMSGLLLLLIGAAVVWVPYQREQAALAAFERRYSLFRTVKRPLVGEWSHDALPDSMLRPFERVVSVHLHCDRPLPPQYLEWLQQLTHLEQLHLYGRYSLAEVADFAQLRAIEIRGGRGGHRAPPHPLRLQNLPRLETAKIVEVPVTQLDIVNVPRLRLLHVKSSRLTETGAMPIPRLDELKALSFAGSKLTDRNLAAIAALPKLQQLDLRYTQITAAGIENFRQQRPDVQVEWFKW